MMNNSKLVGLVKSRPALWQHSNAEHSSRDAVKRNWVEVAEEMSSDVEFVKSKWRGLRENFRKELQKQKSDLGIKSRWQHFSAMWFLRNEISHPPTSAKHCLLKEAEEEECEEEADESSLSPRLSSRESSPIQHKRRRIASDHLLPLVREVLSAEREKWQEARREQTEAEDDEYHFVMSLLPSLRAIPDSRKLHVRTKILAVLLNEQEDNG